KRVPNSALLLIDLGGGKNRLGGSALAQVTEQLGDLPPDTNAKLLRSFFNALTELRQENTVLAYHDRSDGGLLATIAEMSFASHLGVSLELAPLGEDSISALFTEELGAVIQIDSASKSNVLAIFEKQGLAKDVHEIGTITQNDLISLSLDG